MKTEYESLRHRTDEELIAYLYNPEDDHISSCTECRQRLSEMQARRMEVESAYSQEPSFDFIAAQRRKIYARISERERWFSGLRRPRWAPAVLAILVIGGGVAIYQETQPSGPGMPGHYAPAVQQATAQNKVSDAELAADVSQIADNPIPQPAAPAQAFLQAASEE